MNPELHIECIEGASLTYAQRQAIIDLCNRAYEEDLTTLFGAFTGATHILGTVDGTLVTHALWVTRWLQVNDGPLLRTAYIELVATDAAWRNRGFATAVMARVASEILDFDIGALSPFSVSYYARLGWEEWRGSLLIRKDGALLPTPEDEEAMIYRLPNTPALDLRGRLSVEWREGEVW